MQYLVWSPLVLLVFGCSSPATDDSATDNSADAVDSGVDDTGAQDTGESVPMADAFADEATRFVPGDGAGFGQDLFPDVVLGAPVGNASGAPSVDVLSLGHKGVIELAFTDGCAVDGEGVDLLVFENPFSGWAETGVVSASEDGNEWTAWPCDATNVDGGYPGCAGVEPVYASDENGIDPTDPAQAGGDRFDLAEIGLTRACYVRIEDSGENLHDGAHSTSGGFDLDAIAIVNAEAEADD
jgi:hypothetical protein